MSNNFLLVVLTLSFAAACSGEDAEATGGLAGAGGSGVTSGSTGGGSNSTTATTSDGSSTGTGGEGGAGGEGGQAPVIEYLSGDPCSSGNDIVYSNDTPGSCTLDDQALTRDYLLFVPPSYQANGSIVFMLHGHPGTAADMMSYTGLNDTAAAEGFIAVYPNGHPNDDNERTWNIYNQPGRPDDTLFFRALAVELEPMLHFDPKRVYFAGYSGGGIMSHKFAREASDVVAAIGSACGAITADPMNPAVIPPNPVSAILYNSTADGVLDYCTQSNYTLDKPVTDAEFDFWTEADACQTVSPVGSLCAGGNPTAVDMKIGSNCAAGSAVEFYKLIGGSHTYYANLTAALNPAFGNGISTNYLFWNFFKAHPKP